MMITVDTKLIALLGNPLKQSFSARIQNNAFQQHGLDYEYFPIETNSESLESIVRAIRHMNFAGFAVTKPDKVRVMQCLDELDPLAETIGAVNTVVNSNGYLKGYNTDGEGCVRSLKENLDCSMEKAVFVCLGAGGSARAVCSSLAAHGAKEIYVTDLCDQSAKQLVDRINSNIAPVATMIPSEDKVALHRAIAQAQVLMNHTGVGMAPRLDARPIDKEVFRPDLLAFDAIYNPQKSRFLQDAEAKGSEILNGLGMLVYQGAIQFKLWTGYEEPAEIMFKTVNEILAEGKDTL